MSSSFSTEGYFWLLKVEADCSQLVGVELQFAFETAIAHVSIFIPSEIEMKVVTVFLLLLLELRTLSMTELTE